MQNLGYPSERLAHVLECYENVWIHGHQIQSPCHHLRLPWFHLIHQLIIWEFYGNLYIVATSIYLVLIHAVTHLFNRLSEGFGIETVRQPKFLSCHIVELYLCYNNPCSWSKSPQIYRQRRCIWYITFHINSHNNITSALELIMFIITSAFR